MKDPSKIKKEFLNEIILKSLVENWGRRKKIKSSKVSLTKQERESFSRPTSLFKALRDHKNYMSLYALLLKDFIKKTPDPLIHEQKAFYQKNKKLFITPASCQLKQIVVEKKQLIQSLQKKLNQGESFELLSKLHSIKKHPNWVKKGDFKLFDRVCFEQNAPRKPIKSHYGYHVFLVKAKQPGRKKLFKEVQNNIVQILKTKQSKKQFQIWLKQELFKTTVWTNPKLLDKIRIQHKTL